MGGQQPIAGTTIQLWNASYWGDGTPSQPLLSTPAVTDENGNFLINQTSYCQFPGVNALTFITATGGNPGLAAGTNNPAIALAAYLGPCSGLSDSTFIIINEVTTVAAYATISAYVSNYRSVGFGPLTMVNVNNQWPLAAQLVDVRTGASPGTTLPPGHVAPAAKINTLANIVAACVNSMGGVAGDGSLCGQLFSLATTPGQPSPTTVADAVIAISQHPTRNVAALYDLEPPFKAFQPSLTAKPTDWSLAPTAAVPAAMRYPICTMWGDSLTDGSEDGLKITIPSALALLDACATTSKQGIGGQTSIQIAIREGGLPAVGTIAGGIIPAAGSVQVTFPTGHEYISLDGAGDISISGVKGRVLLNPAGPGYVFTRTTSGADTPSPPLTPVLVDNSALDAGFSIIWAGRNDCNLPDQVVADVAAMVAALPSPKHFLVLSVINADNPGWESVGTGGYLSIQTINQQLAAAYPNNFLDARKLIVEHYDPSSPEDVYDHSLDVPPASTRAIDGYAHLLTSIPDKASCLFEVDSNVSIGAEARVDNELIQVLGTGTAPDGNPLVTSCLRGYMGTTLSTHAAGSYITMRDALHLDGPDAGIFLAGKINEWIKANDPAH